MSRPRDWTPQLGKDGRGIGIARRARISTWSCVDMGRRRDAPHGDPAGHSTLAHSICGLVALPRQQEMTVEHPESGSVTPARTICTPGQSPSEGIEYAWCLPATCLMAT